MHQTLEDWKEGWHQSNRCQISNLRYADDTILFASYKAKIAELMDRLEIKSLPIGLAINKSKIKLMVSDRFATTQRTGLLQHDAVDHFQ